MGVGLVHYLNVFLWWLPDFSREGGSHLSEGDHCAFGHVYEKGFPMLAELSLTELRKDDLFPQT